MVDAQILQNLVVYLSLPSEIGKYFMKFKINQRSFYTHILQHYMPLTCCSDSFGCEAYGF